MPSRWKVPRALVVPGKLTLALQHVDFYAGLVVGGGGEDLALLGGDGGVALDDLGAYAAQGLDAQAQRGDVQKQHALDVAAQHAALDGSADGHALVRVDALEGLGAHEFFTASCTAGIRVEPPTSSTLCRSPGCRPASLQRLAHRVHGALHQVGGQLVELGAGQRDVQMLRAGGVRRDERQVDGRAGHAGQLDLGLFGGLLQALRGHFVLAQVDAVFLLELIGQPVDDALVEVVAAQMGVAGSGKHFGHAVAHLDDGHVERAAAQVVDHDLLVVFFIHAVGQRAAAVGSLMMRLTSRPAMAPASLVAWRWLSLKYAGTVMTASVTFSPR